MANAKLIVDIVTNSSKATAGAKEAASGFKSFKSGVEDLAAPAAIAGAAMIAMGADFAKSASNLEQSMGGLDAVFGKSSGQVKKWADTAAESVGLSKTQYSELATVMGAQLQNLGQSQTDAAKSTKSMIELGADLAATYGGTTAQAVEALSSAFKGEADPAERYGLSLSASAVAAKMAADGTDKLTGEQQKAAKAQAIMALATEQAGGALGQYEREADSAAGQTQTATAKFADARAEIGTALLPVLISLATVLATVAEWMTQNKTLVITLMAVIGGFAAVIMAANAAIAIYEGVMAAVKIATAAWTAAQWLLNAAFVASPIGWIILAVAALAAGIVLLWKNSETFRTVVIAVFNAVKTAITTAFTAIKTAGLAAWNAIKAAAGAVVSFITGLWNSFTAFIAGVWNRIRSTAAAAWNAVRSVVQGVINWLTGAWQGALSTISGIWNRLQGLAASAWNAIKAPIESLISWITSRWESLVGIVSGIWNRIAGVIESALSPIQGVIDSIKSAWDSTYGAIKSGVDTVMGWLSGIWDKISGAASAAADIVVPGKSMAGVSVVTVAPPVPGVRGLSPAALAGPVRLPAGGPGAGTTVVVNGALDPDAVARQIERILTARARRVAGVVRLGGPVAV